MPLKYAMTSNVRYNETFVMMSQVCSNSERGSVIYDCLVKVVNGDMRAPLAEQEQEDEEEQDDEVLSSIEEQLEFGDDDMNDLNGE